MGRTPAKIEHGVRCCASANIDKCTGCPYAGLHVGIGCKTILFRDVQDYLKEIKISAARIEDMTKQLESAQPKWISVEENLPKPGETVQLLWKRASDRYLSVCGYMSPLSDIVKTFRFYIFDCNIYVWEDITHWAPLLEPPKEGRKWDLIFA